MGKMRLKSGPRLCALIVAALLLAAVLPRAALAQAPLPPAQEIPDAYRQVGENATFKLFANAETLAFKVVDKRSGYVWSSNLDQAEDGDRLNRTWTAFATSGVSINYLDDKAQSKRASISNAKHTTDFKPVDGGFDATVRFDDPSITIGVSVRLEETGVRVDAPFASVRQENPAFRLGVLHLYPFFGATRTDAIPGYMFLPDGAGTLIRFAAETKAQNMLYSRFYGSDLGMIGEMPWDIDLVRPFKMSLPVIGVAHGDKGNAYLAVVENGAAYGEIQAHPAGVTTNFNFVYPAFIYNESYFQPTNRAGAGVTALQRETNKFDVTVHYRFLTGDAADYVGMARSYQAYLVARGDLTGFRKPDRSDDSHIGIHLEFLGGEAEKVLFWNRSVPMTTVAQMGEILSDLAATNPPVRNAEVVYYGWQPNGASAMPPRAVRLDGSLGSVSELKTLAEKVTAEGGRFYLYFDPQAALLDQGGYSPRRDLAMSIANVALIGFNRYKVNHYFNLPALTEHYGSLARDVAAKLPAGLALDGLGSMLYTDFKPGNFLNREDAIKAYQRMVAETGGTTAFYLPNDYMLGATAAYLDMPLSDSGYIYTSETVPFLQIVLAGYIPYYGSALNFSSNLNRDLLKMADYGMYPSFFLTHEPTAAILNTPSSWIFTSSYEQWGPEVKRTYAWLDALLGPVKGQMIVAREALEDGVMATTYGNGKRVVVNYSDAPVTVDGTTIAARDAALLEAQP